MYISDGDESLQHSAAGGKKSSRTNLGRDPKCYMIKAVHHDVGQRALLLGEPRLVQKLAQPDVSEQVEFSHR